VVIGPVEGDRRGFLADYLCADGSMTELITIPAGGSRQPASQETVDGREHFIRMNGNEVFRVAVRVLCESVLSALDRCGMKPEDLDLVVPHQANTRIIEAASRKLRLPMEKFAVYLDKYGNTSAASVPLALQEARREGRLKPGAVVALVAFGGGMTWGANILRW
jgi:3-oxoacyl-[acyl-carrier-protein] synthase-3